MSDTGAGTSVATDDGDDRRLVLSDLLNRVLDRGLVVSGTVLIAVADVDLIRLDLNLVLTAVESAVRRAAGDLAP